MKIEHRVTIKLMYGKVLRLPLDMFNKMMRQKKFGEPWSCYLCKEAIKKAKVPGFWSGSVCPKCRIPVVPKGHGYSSGEVTYKCIHWENLIFGERMMGYKDKEFKKEMKKRATTEELWVL